MKRIAFLASFMGIFLFVASFAFAHGGSYTGPGGGGSGGGFAPSGGGTPGPGPGPAGGGTGGGGTPGGGGTTGGGDTAPPGGGASGPPGGAPGGAAPGGGGAVPPGAGTTGGGRKPAKTDANLTWGAWWFFNDERYLQLKAKIRNEKNETENADLFTGASDQTEEITTVNAKMIRDKINPVLKFALKDDFYDTRAAALIALGKTGSPDALADLKTLMADDDKRVRESSFLAMGILGNKEAIPTLISVMTDSKEGRKLVGRPNGVLTRTRAFAAMAIGLVGSRHGDLSDTKAMESLIEQMNTKSKQRDSQVAPIVGLGLMKSIDAVPALLKFFNDKSNNAVMRSYAATSLGKIGDPSAIKHLLKGLKDKQNAVTQSCAMALGLLAKPDNVDVVKGLQKMVKSSPDLGAKNFAIISMGEIGGAANLAELIRMAKRGNTFVRTFSSMGLAVYMDKNKGAPERLEVCKRLHKYFNGEKNLDIRGANAIAMGVMRYTEAGEDILKALKKGGQASLRSHLCIALGLMDYDAAIKEVRDTVTDKGDIDLRRNASIALGLLGDKGALKVLEDEMANSARSKAVHGAVTQGLGFIGDVSAVPILVKFVRDRQEYQDVTRAFASVALGLLGDKDNIPILSKISEYNNYLQRTDALTEVLTIL